MLVVTSLLRMTDYWHAKRIITDAIDAVDTDLIGFHDLIGLKLPVKEFYRSTLRSNGISVSGSD